MSNNYEALHDFGIFYFSLISIIDYYWSYFPDFVVAFDCYPDYLYSDSVVNYCYYFLVVFQSGDYYFSVLNENGRSAVFCGFGTIPN